MLGIIGDLVTTMWVIVLLSEDDIWFCNMTYQMIHGLNPNFGIIFKVILI